MKRLLCTLVFALILPAAQIYAQESPAPVTSVAKVDLERYSGQWYEVAAIPQYFQRQCVRNTTATYKRGDDGMIEVLNQCQTETGEIKPAQGRARVVDTATNSKLEVTFLSIFGQWLFWIGGDYWVIGLDEKYQWAIVGHPTRKYGWVLSRTPALSAEHRAQVEAVLKKNSYDLCTLLVSPQTGGETVRKPFCEKSTP